MSSQAGCELLELAEKIDAPVTTTLMGISGFPSEHPSQSWHAWHAWVQHMPIRRLQSVIC